MSQLGLSGIGYPDWANTILSQIVFKSAPISTVSTITPSTALSSASTSTSSTSVIGGGTSLTSSVTIGFSSAYVYQVISTLTVEVILAGTPTTATMTISISTLYASSSVTLNTAAVTLTISMTYTVYLYTQSNVNYTDTGSVGFSATVDTTTVTLNVSITQYQISNSITVTDTLSYSVPSNIYILTNKWTYSLGFITQYTCSFASAANVTISSFSSISNPVTTLTETTLTYTVYYNYIVSPALTTSDIIPSASTLTITQQFATYYGIYSFTGYQAGWYNGNLIAYCSTPSYLNIYNYDNTVGSTLIYQSSTEETFISDRIDTVIAPNTNFLINMTYGVITYMSVVVISYS